MLHISIEYLFPFLLVLALVLGIWFETQATPRTKWDRMAANMWVEGYTEFDIRNELGPRPD